MGVLVQHKTGEAIPVRGARARTARLMLASAVRLMQRGVIPSVSEVAEEAGVSRATAYRYFPSQAALVQAVVDEALGPILEWRTDETDAQARMRDLLRSSLPRMYEFEATFRAALRHALDEWSTRQAGNEAGDEGGEPSFTRGHRRDLVASAAAPMREALGEPAFDRLAKALSLVFGVEALVVLKDIWGCGEEETSDILDWAARALIAAAGASKAEGGAR